jgi:hypothetical protein
MNQYRELFFHTNQDFEQEGTKSCRSEGTITELQVNNATGCVNDDAHVQCGLSDKLIITKKCS